MANLNNPKRVLVVDDDLSLQKILTDKLTQSGIQVSAVTTGDDALQAAKKQPHLILLDIMLKGSKNGFDVLEELKRDPILRPIPVIVLTNLDGEQKSALSIGAVDYIEKTNISIDEVVLKVKNLLQ